jgi:hypothetical protein
MHVLQKTWTLEIAIRCGYRTTDGEPINGLLRPLLHDGVTARSLYIVTSVSTTEVGPIFVTDSNAALSTHLRSLSNNSDVNMNPQPNALQSKKKNVMML